MTALGRILQVVGWLWIALGLFGSVVNLPDVSVFPGIIILFISRVVRKQGEQQTQREEGGAEHTEEPETARPLNTERLRSPAQTKKVPQRASMAGTEATSPTKSSPGPKVSLPAPKSPGDTKERDELLERVLLVGREMADEPGEPRSPEPISEEGESRPMTSAEMIARAHRRWDRKP